MNCLQPIDQSVRNFRQTLIDCCQAEADGILHLGAHKGQERGEYAKWNPPVLWVEAHALIFQELKVNISEHKGQHALCAVLADVDGRMIDFHLSNNSGGVSSSVFPFGEYAIGPRSLWPNLELGMIETITLPTQRLDTLLSANGISSSDYDFWVADLQGSEGLAFDGAATSIKACRALLIEASLVQTLDDL